LTCCQTGAIMKKVRNRANPMMIWLEGICCTPSAFLTRESTMIIRVNEVTIIKRAGASESTVNMRSN